MNGVTLGEKHSYRDFKLILRDRIISLPEVQTSAVSIPGRDGELDFSEALDGMVHYGNRSTELTLESVRRLTRVEWSKTLSSFAAYVHGQKLKIVFDDDPGYYYIGRCSISRYAYDMATTYQQFTVSCDCQPFKLEVTPSVVTANVNTADRAIHVMNGRKPAIPTITLSADCVITAFGQKITLPAGTYHTKEIQLAPGLNTALVRTVEDVGTITISYTKGEL